jgi:hypothetical protein
VLISRQSVRKLIVPRKQVLITKIMGIMIVLSYCSKHAISKENLSGCRLQVHLEHLPVPHLNRQEHHHQGRDPDTTGAEPEDTGALVREQLSTGVRCNDTRDSTQAREHTADTAAIFCVEKLGRRGVKNSVEIL